MPTGGTLGSRQAATHLRFELRCYGAIVVVGQAGPLLRQCSPVLIFRPTLEVGHFCRVFWADTGKKRTWQSLRITVRGTAGLKVVASRHDVDVTRYGNGWRLIGRMAQLASLKRNGVHTASYPIQALARD